MTGKKPAKSPTSAKSARTPDSPAYRDMSEYRNKVVPHSGADLQERLSRLSGREDDIDLFVRQAAIYEGGLNSPAHVAELERQLEEARARPRRRGRQDGVHDKIVGFESGDDTSGGGAGVSGGRRDGHRVDLVLSDPRLVDAWAQYVAARGGNQRAVLAQLVEAELVRDKRRQSRARTAQRKKARDTTR